MQLVVAGAAAVAVPVLFGGLVGSIPFGAVGAAVVGILVIWFGRKTEGVAKGLLVGAGVGLLANLALSFVPQLTATATA